MYVTVAQFAATTDKAENLATAARFIAEAAERGTSLVVLPENAMYSDPDPAADVRPAAESVNGPFAQSIAQAAKRAGVAVIVGMTETPTGDDDRCTNAVLAVDEQGRTIGVYRKVHLYDAFGYRESDRIVAHEPRPLVFDRDGMRFGVMTCYDLRFPEMARFLVDAGAEVLIVPAAWLAGPAKEDHWTTLLRARAIENTVYVLACGQTGPINVGHSAIIDPMGQIVAGAGEAPGFVTAWIDHARLEAVRAKNPSLANRRFGVRVRGADG
ncbi:MAG: deaminated glutathione amidase [Mycobacterium sp.]|jgi:predicted amidohydrolase|nr:deaminated glutathione amidase [Mycobacterium sp.]